MSEPFSTAYDHHLVQRARRLRLGNRFRSGSQLLGGYRSRIKGNGLEYVESRAYMPGDDVRRMDWTVTARTAHPYVKLFEEEKQLRILQLVDVGASMFFGGRQRTKLQTALSAAVALAYAAMRDQDVSQLLLFGGEQAQLFSPVRRAGEFSHMCHQLDAFNLSPYQQPVRRKTALEAMVQTVAAMKHRPSVVLLYSDLSPIEQFEALGPRLASIADLLIIQTLSRLEIDPKPMRRVRLYSPDSRRAASSAKAVPTVSSLWGRRVHSLTDDGDIIADLQRVLGRR